MLAVVLSAIGKKNGVSWMMKEGLKIYVSALGQAQTSLKHPMKWKADNLLLACSALGLFEVLHSPFAPTQVTLMAY